MCKVSWQSQSYSLFIRKVQVMVEFLGAIDKAQGGKKMLDDEENCETVIDKRELGF